MSKKPRVVLLHGTPVAVDPIQRAFATRWPEAETVDLLDSSLSVDRAKDHELTPRMFERFVELGGYAQRLGAEAILVTCSAFGPAIERMAKELPMPVLKPNEAMFREAIGRGRRIGMLATFAPSVLTMTEEFEQFVAEAGAQASLETIVVEGAMDALRKGRRRPAQRTDRRAGARARALRRHHARAFLDVAGACGRRCRGQDTGAHRARCRGRSHPGRHRRLTPGITR